MLARLETGDYGIDADRLTADCEALAAKIAAILMEHRDKT
jgi:hypothetical protein